MYPGRLCACAVEKHGRHTWSGRRTGPQAAIGTGRKQWKISRSFSVAKFSRARVESEISIQIFIFVLVNLSTQFVCDDSLSGVSNLDLCILFVIQSHNLTN